MENDDPSREIRQLRKDLLAYRMTRNDSLASLWINRRLLDVLDSSFGKVLIVMLILGGFVASYSGLLNEPTRTSPSTRGVAAPTGVAAVNSLYRLNHDSPVFKEPDDTSEVLAHVHDGKSLHVTGVAGPYLLITMKDGTVGFVPAAVADYEADWVNKEAAP